MSPRGFSRLLAAVYAEPFSDGRLQVVIMASHDHYFTCGQARRLVGAMMFSDDREQAAVALYPRVVDPGNFFQVMAALTFESSKAQVRVQLGL